MSICFSGLDIPCCVHPVTIDVSPAHPLIQLAQVIPWQGLADMVLADLKRTTAQGKWWLGRKLTLRIHLGAFLLQWLYHLTDRQVDWAIKENAAYQHRAREVRGARADRKIAAESWLSRLTWWCNGEIVSDFGAETIIRSQEVHGPGMRPIKVEEIPIAA